MAAMSTQRLRAASVCRTLACFAQCARVRMRRMLGKSSLRYCIPVCGWLLLIMLIIMIYGIESTAKRKDNEAEQRLKGPLRHKQYEPKNGVFLDAIDVVKYHPIRLPLIKQYKVKRHGSCSRFETSLDWARPRQSLRYPAKCTPVQERDEVYREFIYDAVNTLNDLYVFWVDAKRELVLTDAIPLDAPLCSMVTLWHDSTLPEERAFFRTAPLDEVRRVLAETILSHPLKDAMVHSWTKPDSKWHGPFLEELMEHSPQVRLDTLCERLQQLTSTGADEAAWAYQVALLMTLDLLQSSKCPLTLQEYFVLAEARRDEADSEESSLFVPEARIFHLALELSAATTAREAVLLEEVKAWTMETNHPVGHVFLAARFGRDLHVQECEKAAYHLIQAFGSIRPYIYEDSRGVHERHERVSYWHEQGLGQLEYDAMRNVQDSFATKEEYFQAIDHLLSPAAMEDPRNVIDLGDLYLNGNVQHQIPRDVEKAVRWYRHAMDRGLGLGASRIGYMIVHNELAVNNKSEAYAYFVRALELGEPVGALGLAQFFHGGQLPIPDPHPPRNLTEALRLLEIAGAHGLNAAYYLSGMVYLEEPTMLNMTMAENMFRVAYDQGHVLAAYELGKLMFFSPIHEAQCSDALGFLKTALRADWTRYFAFDSERGFQRWLANPDAALVTYRLARTMLWQKEAELNAAFILELGIDHGAADDDATGQDTRWGSWFLRALNHSKTSTLDAAHQARAFYESAVRDHNNSEAVRKLGDCFALPWPGVCPLDEYRALLLYSKAKEMGDVEAIWNLGHFYEHGKGGLQRNSTQALVEFELVQTYERGYYPGLVSWTWLMVKMHLLSWLL